MRLLKYSMTLLLLAFFTSCEDEIDPFEGAVIQVTYEGSTTPIQIKLIDARTEEVIGFDQSIDVDVSIHGEGASAITDTWGIQESVYESEVGLLSLAVDPNMPAPNPTNPIRISVQAKATGYLDTGKSVSIVQEGPQFVIIHMVRKTDTPEGVEYISDNVSDALSESGSVQDALELFVPSNKAKITVPQDMVMLDEMGQPLSGNITIEMTYFDNTEQDALLAYPGGLLTEINNGGTMEDGMFYSAGFVAIDITDQNGNEATTFEQGTIRLKTVIDAETFNPLTNTSVSANDEVGVYSYEPETGEWTFENNVTIENGASGLVATAELSHLSFYNLDWWWGQTCQSANGALIYFFDFLGDCAEQYDSTGVYLEYYITRVETGDIIGNGAHYFQKDLLYSLGSWTSPSTAVAIDWITDPDGGQCGPVGPEAQIPAAFNPLFIDDACAQQQYGSEIAIENCGDLISVNANLLCLAENLDVNFLNWPWFGLKESSCYYWEWYPIQNGSITFTGNLSSSYDFWIEDEIFYNVSIPDSINLDGEHVLDLDIEIPEDACGLFE